MDLVASAIDAYADAHTTAPPDYLRALDAEAREALPHPSMLSGPVVGRLLETLVALAQPELVLEIGTYAGSSALWMARGLPADALIVTCEIDPDHAAFAQRHIGASPHADRIDVRVGPALDTITALDGPFDFVFVDAEKTGYPEYVDAVLEKLSPDGLIVLDNMLRDGEVLDPDAGDEGTRAVHALNERLVTAPGLACTLLTVRDGLMLIRRA